MRFESDSIGPDRHRAQTSLDGHDDLAIDGFAPEFPRPSGAATSPATTHPAVHLAATGRG